MFWADKTAKEIIESGQYKPYKVDDMFTPSGHAHIGSLRGPLVHDMIFRALRDEGASVTQTYILNDFDPIDGLPPDLQDGFQKYMGVPLRSVPSPDGKARSFADFFANDFLNVLKSLGHEATYFSSWDMYHEGKFNDVIQEALDNAEKIQDIYRRVSGSKKKEKGWFPLQVICEQCGKLGTTRVHDWDGKTVAYTCEPTMVTWAKGCGHTGRISPFDGKGKLPWKVDWPAHWKVLGVTIEGAGKDHSSAGGSRDIAKELCKEVFHIHDPYNLPYEFFLIGGKKMSSSKGLGLKARDLTSVLPASVGRFLFTRTDYRQAIEFDPMETMAIPDLFDEYDRCWQAYIDKSDEALARAYELSIIEDKMQSPAPAFIPRFRLIANYIQLPNIDLQKKFEELKGKLLTFTELQILKERQKYASVWLGRFAPQELRMSISTSLPSAIKTLSEKQKKFLTFTVDLVEKIDNPDGLQLALFNGAKEMGLTSLEAFSGIYLSFLGKDHGPRAAWFLLQYPKDQVIKRLKEAALADEKHQKDNESKKTISKPEFFVVHQKVKRAYPSVSVGIALVKGVKISKSNAQLENEKETFLGSLQNLSTEILSSYPEVISYRRLYKEMGVDWHSRRPSPEALLRRISLGKGLYSVNTCVDAYNLVVMKHRVSVGAFDANEIKFPTVLQFAKEGDEILLLGDKESEKYSAKELAYYDQKGGYNIDFNFRDAQRTMVTDKTKNLWINVDGVYDISPRQVEETLQEAVEKIIKYCGGKVEFQGVIQ